MSCLYSGNGKPRCDFVQSRWGCDHGRVGCRIACRRKLEVRASIQRVEKDGELAGNGGHCKWHIDLVDILSFVSSPAVGRVEFTAGVTEIFAVESLAQFKYVCHEGIGLFCRTLEYARLLQARELILVHVLVLHGEKRVRTCFFVFGIGDSCDLDHLLGDNHNHGGV